MLGVEIAEGGFVGEGGFAGLVEFFDGFSVEAVFAEEEPVSTAELP